MPTSIYDPNVEGELTRLRIQSSLFREFDRRAIESALKKLGANQDICVLDVGCSDGQQTSDRFSGIPQIGHIVGIDRDKEAIHLARRSHKAGRFHFLVSDLEKENTSSALEQHLKQVNIQSVDLVFSALVVHHLSNPVGVLQNLKDAMTPGGVIILRGSDDGMKLAYPDENGTLASIFAMSKNSLGASDRENGRKLYHHLSSAGFRNISLLHHTIDTSNITTEDRIAMFESSFSYRANVFRARCARQPDEPFLREELSMIVRLLDELRGRFQSKEFYYQETTVIALGIK